jgi:acyl carrier protein
MTNIERILQCIYPAIDEVNELLSDQEILEKSLDTILFGELSSLNSLDFLNLLMAVEENLEEEFSVPVTITDEKAVSVENSPFKTVQSLANYIESIINEPSDD